MHGLPWLYSKVRLQNIQETKTLGKERKINQDRIPILVRRYLIGFLNLWPTKQNKIFHFKPGNSLNYYCLFFFVLQEIRILGRIKIHTNISARSQLESVTKYGNSRVRVNHIRQTNTRRPRESSRGGILKRHLNIRRRVATNITRNSFLFPSGRGEDGNGLYGKYREKWNKPKKEKEKSRGVYRHEQLTHGKTN